MRPLEPIDRRTFLAAGAALGAGASLAPAFGSARPQTPVEPVPFPALPYAVDALEPVISKTTLETHHGKHHGSYHAKAVKAASGTELAGQPMRKVMLEAFENPKLQSLYNNSAQAFNHDFYWKSMRPGGGGVPTGKMERVILDGFGSYDRFRDAFVQQCMGHFGSGWGWLVILENKAQVMTTSNADNPLTLGVRPLLTIDLWEHAYYLDHKNVRAEYIRGYLNRLVDWDFALNNYRS